VGWTGRRNEANSSRNPKNHRDLRQAAVVRRVGIDPRDPAAGWRETTRSSRPGAGLIHGDNASRPYTASDPPWRGVVGALK